MSVWRDIHDVLRREIEDGRHRTGDRLPTESVMAARFGVNRHTIRRAMAALTEAGLISVRRGSGAYVAAGVLDYRLGRRVKFSQNVGDLGRIPGHVLLEGAVGPAPAAAARHLRIKPDAPVTILRLRSDVDGLPVLYARHMFPAARFPDLIEAFREALSISAALRRYGVIDYTRKWTRLTATTPSRRIGEILGQAEGQPVIVAKALNLDMSGTPIEYAKTYWSASRVQFVVQGSDGA